MADPTRTFTAPASGPGPVREGALARLIACIGEREEGGKNWGPFVQKVAAPFISPERLATFAPGQKRAGKLLWCALAVCWAILMELLDRGQKERAAQWRRIASSECSVLFENMEDLGWAWRRGAPLPAALSPQGVDVPGLPGPGDLVFYGSVKPDGTLHITHVDFFETNVSADGDDWDSVGGNTGWPVSDKVDRCHHHGPEDLVKVLAYARLPW